MTDEVAQQEYSNIKFSVSAFIYIYIYRLVVDPRFAWEYI